MSLSSAPCSALVSPALSGLSFSICKWGADGILGAQGPQVVSGSS